MSNDVSCLMVAYNAENTIERAVNSALPEVDHIFLVDDGSSDKTAKQAKEIGGDRITIKSLSNNQGIGAARQAAVEMCGTEYACWLDADDEWVPGRVKKLLTCCRNGADYVFDESELYCGDTNKKTTNLNIPEFLFREDGLSFQLGRNYLPTLGVPMVRSSVLKEVGYRPELRQAEDFDHFIRAFMSGKNIQLASGISYREYSHLNSASRNLSLQNHFLKQAYKGVSYEDIVHKLETTKLGSFERTTIAAMYLARIECWGCLIDLTDPFNGTLGKDGWVTLFYQGVAHYQMGNYPKAFSLFNSIENKQVLPEVLNNIGACCLKLGEDASDWFEQSLRLKPDYLDASNNLRNPGKPAITVFPLRTITYRGQYKNN